MRRLGPVLLAALLLAGCSAVKLRHPQTGDTVGCGMVPMPAWYGIDGARKAATEELQCIERHERQGYQIVRK